MDLVEIFNKKIKIISIISFIVLTFISAITRIPFYDEAHAWIISTFNLEQIIHLTRIEGHPILWYLILKPFSNLDLYPYSLTLINWLFSSILVIFFWKFAPFNNLIKFLITFSYPFIGYFGIISRPYTLGVLIIFLLAYFYKKNTQKPILYSLLLVLSSNIAIIPFIVSGSFGILFIYDIFKNKINKKQLCSVFLILLFGAILFIFQFIFFKTPNTLDYNSSEIFLSNLIHFIYQPFWNIENENPIRVIFFSICCSLLYYLIFIFFKQDKKTLLFSLFSFGFLIIFFSFFYTGDFWHYYFFFIALISSLWLSWDKIKNIKFLNIILTIFFIFTLSPYSFFSNGIAYKTNTKNYNLLLKSILENKNLKNGKLFCADLYSPLCPGILPYLKKNNITLYDTKGYDRMSYENFLTLQNKIKQKVKIKTLIENLDKNKKNYLIAGQKFNQMHHDFSITQNNQKLFFKLLEYKPEIDFAIYEIIQKQ